MGTEKSITVVNDHINAPSRLIEIAISKGADLDKLEKLLSLQERYEANEARKAYNDAMSQFKANPPDINKDKTVTYGTTKYSHASLFNVTDKVNKELSKYGLSASWKTTQNGTISVTCKITHIKGHSEETMLTAPSDTSGSKNAIQAIGSTVSYLQRYTLLSLTGLATHDQDDDAVAATEKITEAQAAEITALAKEKNVAMEILTKAYHIESIDKLPSTRYSQVVNMLKAKKV
jgi:hypothetical protein